MNRADLQKLAEERVLDAKALLDAGRWSGAFYLAGYAIECALKACIARQTSQYDFPDRDRVQKSYSHDIEALLVVAGLRVLRDQDSAANPKLANHWSAVKDWSEKARYQAWTEANARDLYAAVTDPGSGVFPWIKAHW